jgi:hypothetical protein
MSGLLNAQELREVMLNEEVCVRYIAQLGSLTPKCILISRPSSPKNFEILYLATNKDSRHQGLAAKITEDIQKETVESPEDLSGGNVFVQATETAFWFYFGQDFSIVHPIDPEYKLFVEHGGNHNPDLYLMWKQKGQPKNSHIEYLKQLVKDLLPKRMKLYSLEEDELKKLEPNIKAGLKTDCMLLDKMAAAIVFGIP